MDKDGIVSWITKKLGPPSTAVGCDGLKEKIADSKLVVAFFGDEADPLFQEAHYPYADSDESVEFVHAPAECAVDQDAPVPGIVLFRNFDEPKHIYTGPADKKSLKDFVKSLKTPTVFEFS